ncbi:MAG: hypothetical protein U0L37_07820, partial [Bacteroidales bacterium]|nr:hypothetical protein [Bacteroidales bacterium]
MSEEQNNNGKAKVIVITDADCELILDDEIIATVQKDKTKQIFVERGEHFFTARSTEFPQIEEEIEKTIDDLSFKYSLRIKLADKLQSLREKIRKKKEEEQRLREEEERRRKKEAERLEREKREAEERKKEEERRRREWESMTPIEQAVKRLMENPSPNPKILTGHFNGINSVAVSPDGKYLASGSSDYTVIIWDAKSGQRLKTLEGHYYCVRSVSWSPDGKYLASGSQFGPIIIWDAKSG